jgi:hypothetical protein
MIKQFFLSNNHLSAADGTGVDLCGGLLVPLIDDPAGVLRSSQLDMTIVINRAIIQARVFVIAMRKIIPGRGPQSPRSRGDMQSKSSARSSVANVT